MEFITGEEKKQLEEQLAERVQRRKEIRERIAEARALGDLKENAEYHAAREDQGMNEAKIAELETRLRDAKVADDSELPDGMVFLGAVVKLRDVESGDEDVYKLVGSASNDFNVDWIEVTTTSPMGVALMKSSVGEEIRVDLPRGAKRFEILAIVD